jgi:hypothetical protein
MTSQCEHHDKTIGSGQWEDVVAPFDCSYYSIVGPAGAAFDKCCDKSDASKSVTGLTSHVVSAPPSNQSLPGSRWKQGEVITYVRSSVPLNLYFLK